MSKTRSPGSEPIREGLVTHLWAGDNLALHADLLRELESSGIPFFNKPVGNYPGAERAMNDYVPQPPFGSGVKVFASDLPAARQILERLEALGR
jgi:hypothetical protein